MKLSRHTLKLIIPMHIICLTMFVHFLLKMRAGIHLNSIWLIFLGWLLISGFGVAIGQHRYFCHKSFKTNVFFHYILGYLACLGGQGSPIFWNAIHCVHHKYSDDIGDFHSPKKGLWKSYWGWIFNLSAEEIPMKYSKNLISDTFHKLLHTQYYKIVWMTIFLSLFVELYLCHNYINTFFFLIIPITYSMHQESIINVFCHFKGLGYRNYNTNDDSNNNFLLGLFGFGQGFHNNHHAKPNSYDFGVRWFEYDICKHLIMLIETSPKDKNEL